MHVLRCSPPHAVAEGVAVFDDSVHSFLGRIVVAGAPGLGSLQAEIAALHLSVGGLGLVRAEDILPVASLASVLQTQRDQLLQEEVLAGWVVSESRAVEAAWLSFVGVCPDFNSELMDEDFLETDVQRKLSEFLSNISRRALLALPAWEHLVQVLESVARSYALGWLQALPVERMGQVMANIEFWCRLRYQLLIPMFPSGARCPQCGQGTDRWGDHAVHCRVGRGVVVTFRHKAVRDVLFRIGKDLEAVVTREPPLPLRAVGFEARRPDLLFLDWDGGRDLYVDVVGLLHSLPLVRLVGWRRGRLLAIGDF
eukprot:jgi/Botrbrau1/21381/Bobra.0216s0003.1